MAAGSDFDMLEEGQMRLTADQRAELDRRLETLDADKQYGISWAELKAELERLCP